VCVWRVRHGINRDQNFYCFFPLPREVVETATCTCAAVSLVRRRHLTFLFEFHWIFRPEVFSLYMSMANCTPTYTRTLGGFKSSPFDVIGSYTHLVHTHTHKHACILSYGRGTPGESNWKNALSVRHSTVSHKTSYRRVSYLLVYNMIYCVSVTARLVGFRWLV